MNRSILFLLLSIIIAVFIVIIEGVSSQDQASFNNDQNNNKNNNKNININNRNNKNNKDDDEYTSSYRVGGMDNLVHFTPFYKTESCSGDINGVGFGSMPFECSYNASGLSYSIVPVFGSAQYNISTHQPSQIACAYEPVYWQAYNAYGNCQYSSNADSSYQVFWAPFPPPIPKYSVVQLSLYDACSSVSSYWYATNGTVLPNYGTDTTTTYYCDDQGRPFIQTCSPNASCQQDSFEQKCSFENPLQTFCTTSSIY
ncbi:hypothetical protein DFA_03557 [Cavenderia fasciculata]|uniref:Uncharacterized protein n=1 Tax=Cavenderia fasciculata TaxID=261658 RepID=F4PHX4_CACFS|nr:uncharacterized protein DFA_03557 [Cavenderia fasciculata]EGG25308.1 hypothetical protein DFA_03557 [Cavenderia fasciculata]|eukprot:XP_004363159.1 hypothetical protein DFA_03557 [Cavenderia fasciculata]